VNDSPPGTLASLYDFCLWPYEPLTQPVGKHPFSHMLRASFQLAQRSDRLLGLLERIQDAIGPQATVWGIKWNRQVLTWELYFYDYARLKRTISIERLRAVLGQDWTGPPEIEHIPYFMFSIEVNDLGEISPVVDIYVGVPGSIISAGLCYSYDNDGIRLKNLYHFFDAKHEFEEVLHKLSNSIHLPSTIPDLDELLWPQVRHCQTLVVANKRAADGLYYSRVGVEQLCWFADRMDYPVSFRRWLEAEREGYSHMLFDLGVDFRTRDGRLEFMRGAFFGVA
jgi:hypothetical protein